MRTTIAALAGLGLLAACNQPTPAKPEEKTPVAEQPKPEDPAFASAVNFECEGGGKLDAVFDQGPDGRNVKMRMDGGAAVMLAFNPDSQNAMEYKDATTSLAFEGDRVVYKSGATSKACQFKSRSLPPPASAGVVKTLYVEDAGKTVEIKKGEKVAVALVGVPTAGYVWAAAKPPAWVKASDGPGGATSTSQFLPGFTGGNHWEVVLIEGVAAGEGEITLAQRRPWESDAEPAAETFKFKLKVS